MNNSSSIQSRLMGLRESSSVSRVLAAMKSNGAEPIESRSFCTSAGNALALWETRYRNTNLTGVPIPGALLLIEKLRQLPVDAEVQQYGFTGDKFAGSIFFNRQTGEFLGDTIVERRPKNQAKLDVEDRLIDRETLALARSGAAKRSA